MSDRSDSSVPDWCDVTFGDLLGHRRERGRDADPLLSVTASQGVVLQAEAGRRDISNADKSAYWRVFPGDVAYNSMRMWQGVSGRSDYFGIVSPAYTVCTPTSLCDSAFVSHLLKHPPSVAAFKTRSQGLVSDTWNLKYRSFSAIKTRVPISVAEQRHIADILDTIDDCIRSTETFIAKLEQMKQGLLHDLLTRGIDENGELRDPIRNPDQFHTTDLGLLPITWDARPLGSLLANVDPSMRSGPFGSALLKAELVSEGVPMLGIDNVNVEQFVPTFSRFVTAQKFHELSRYAVRPNDIMITIMGTVGRCCEVPSDIGDALSSKHVWTLTIDEAMYLPFLVCLQVNYSDWVLRHFSKDTQGGIMSAIRSETLRSVLLPTPPIQEQVKIASVLSTENERLASLRAELAKLQLLKVGLMDDLLTGRVRVKVDNGDAA